MTVSAEVRRVYRYVGVENAHSLDFYRKHGGYEAWRRVVTEMTPDAVIEAVKASGLRGRGGAGFPAGVKWGFVPKDPDLDKYIIANGDESEPGTFKDRYIMEDDPHLLVEGTAIGAYAIGARVAFIYIRGELAFAAQRLEAAIAEAEKAGLLGERIFGTDYGLKVLVHRGAGAYICGEETALLDSLEGRRAEPRLRPPFPAVKGLYGKPTIVNNVETLANVPLILAHGAEWFRSVGTEKSPGTKLLCVSGRVKRPGVYELPMGFPLDRLIHEVCGGMQDNLGIKAIIPGGSSVPFLGPEHFGVPLDFESVAAAGSQLGCGAVIVIDSRACAVRVSQVLVDFYHHESCGKCTPCREGTGWLSKIIHRIEEGKGRGEDLDLLLNVCEKMDGKCFCLLGESAIPPVHSSLSLFRGEWEHHIRERRCMVA